MIVRCPIDHFPLQVLQVEGTVKAVLLQLKLEKGTVKNQLSGTNRTGSGNIDSVSTAVEDPSHNVPLYTTR